MEKRGGLYGGIIIIAMVLGFMLSMQFKAEKATYNPPTVSFLRVQGLVTQVENYKEDRENLQIKIEELRNELDKAIARPQLAMMKEELDLARIHAGMVPVKGTGVEVTLNDSALKPHPGQNPNLYVLHDEDILNVLNELKASGAEAIAINNNRITANTGLRCSGPTIIINRNTHLAPPFVILAIGESATLKSGLNMPGGIADTLRNYGIQVTIKEKDEIIIPAYKGTISIEIASNGPEGGVETD